VGGARGPIPLNAVCCGSNATPNWFDVARGRFGPFDCGSTTGLRNAYSTWPSMAALRPFPRSCLGFRRGARFRVFRNLVVGCSACVKTAEQLSILHTPWGLLPVAHGPLDVRPCPGDESVRLPRGAPVAFPGCYVLPAPPLFSSLAGESGIRHAIPARVEFSFRFPYRPPKQPPAGLPVLLHSGRGSKAFEPGCRPTRDRPPISTLVDAAASGSQDRFPIGLAGTASS